MSLIDRLSGAEDPHISSHQFYSALLALRDSVIDRTQMEALFDIATTGDDATELDFIIDSYNIALDKHRYVEALHAVFMLLERNDFNLTKGQVQAWLTTARSELL